MSRTRGSSLARHSCITCSAGRSSPWRALPAALASGVRGRRRSAVGFAMMIVLVSLQLFVRPRRRAGLRAPVAARGGAAPMRAFLAHRAVALVLPAAASAHATLVSTAPRFGTELQREPEDDSAALRPARHGAPGSLRVLNGVGKNFAGPARVEGTELVAHVRPLQLGAYTVRWQSRSRRTRTSSRACGRSASACPRRR